MRSDKHCIFSGLPANWASMAPDSTRSNFRLGYDDDDNDDDDGINGRSTFLHLQRWAIRWALGCVNSRFAYRGNQEVVFTQPWAHLCK